MIDLTADRPKLLFLSQCLPFPPDGGVKIRTFHVLRLLSKAFDVTALCFYRSKGGILSTDLERSANALREFGDLTVYPLPQEQSGIRLVGDHLLSVLARRVYTVRSYESRRFRAGLEAQLAHEQFAIVHADSLDLSGYFPLVRSIPLACTHHDAQSSLLRRRAVHEKSAWRRGYIAHQADLMEREERDWCQRVSLNITVSEVDRATLRLLAPRGNFVVVPNGVDVQQFRPQPGGEAGVLFVGGSTWFPNRDAIEFFCERILPLLRTIDHQIAVRWVGRSTDADKRSFGDRFGVEVKGYVKDVRPYLRDAACVVVPIRIGGGTRIKILDAWAMGKAVVSTSIGCEGLAARDGDNILIRDNPAAFAEAVRCVTQDRELRARLGASARATVEREYSWEVVGKALVDSYRELIRSSAERSAPKA